MDEKRFLIRLGDQFVSGFNSKWQPLCVQVPSAARHYDYRTADALVQVLREKNFQAYVSDSLGQPATLEVIEQEMQAAVQQQQK
jgi:hypothetical protein